MDAKQTPPAKVRTCINLDTETKAMLSQMTNNKSWLVNKLIREAWLRDFSAEQRGKALRPYTPKQARKKI